MPEQEKQEKNKPLRDKRGRLLPGQCGNPKGHPKGVPNYQARFKKLLEEISCWKTPKSALDNIHKHFPDAPEDMLIEMAEAIRVHVAALEGEQWAYDRLHGKAPLSIDHTSGGEKIDLSGKSREELIDIIVSGLKSATEKKNVRC